MKKTFLFLTVLCFYCCGSSPTEVVAQQVSSKPVAAKVKPDTIKQNTNYIISTARPSNKINKQFPYDIDLKTAEGKMVNTKEILQNNGKPTVLLFWLTTCYPCRMELQALQEVYEQYANETDFNMVAISTDFQKNYPNFVKRVNESNWPWEAYNDVNREFSQVMPGALNGLPQSFVIDKNGQIVYHKRKYSSGDEIILMEKVKEIASK